MSQEKIRTLYEQYKNGIYRYALSIMKDSREAEDILHDTFVKVLSDGLRCASGKEQAWLYRVARNLCFDRLRRAKKEQPQTQLPEDPENRYAYIDLIASLSPQEQELVTLKIVGGLSHGEIGQILGITAKAAQKRYERAIATLREKEEDHGTKTV